ncbi:MAG: ChaN family lipoprotein [Candidatus Nealsonbacteria bacterium]|nr:ChaN family lipoprotein [Candidatus Nealsonbacteria bacterium]
MYRFQKILTSCCLAMFLGASSAAALAAEDERRANLWVDLYQGEPVRYENVLDDLAGVRVIYLGECHALESHHKIQNAILRDLARKDVSLVLALEQMEHVHQPHLDRYNVGEIDFKRLAELTKWPERWGNYKQYEPILKTARRFQIPVLALNARSETIRQVARKGGVEKLEPELRKELPKELQLIDPPYEKLLNLQLMVHMAFTAERLRPIREAQICRDEMMASVLSSFLESKQGKDRTAIVLCGAGHISFGLGTPTRVRRRIPDLKDRVILLSQSGDLELSPEELAQAREIEITHDQLREINRPIADYLHVRALARQNNTQGHDKEGTEDE